MNTVTFPTKLLQLWQSRVTWWYFLGRGCEKFVSCKNNFSMQHEQVGWESYSRCAIILSAVWNNTAHPNIEGQQEKGHYPSNSFTRQPLLILFGQLVLNRVLIPGVAQQQYCRRHLACAKLKKKKKSCILSFSIFLSSITTVQLHRDWTGPSGTPNDAFGRNKNKMK